MTRNGRERQGYAFSGHETFPLRYTWLPKGVRHLEKGGDLFIRDDALVTLGVGKNMVRSIRHWCEALEVTRRTDRRGRAEVTPFGRALLGPGGWDPFLEDPGTLWLLHWRLVRTPSPASTWHLGFTVWNEGGFTRDRLIDWLLELAHADGRSQATRASVRRDVEVFIRTYVPSRTKRDLALEDTFDCPLVELGLVREEGEGAYSFERGPKQTLPDAVFVHALLDFWDRSFPGQGTLAFERILYDAGGPGGAFKLSENALAERLERLPESTDLYYDDTAGMRVVLRRGSTESDDGREEADEVLRRYYEGVGEVLS